MSTKDGAFGILELGDVTPDIRPVRVLMEGKPVILDAYVDGPTCPGTVRAKISKSLRKYRGAVYQDGPAGEDRVFVHDAEAWTDHLRELLMAAIPGLGYAAADVLCGDEDRALRILEDLGYREKSTPAEASDPNAPGEESTTADSSPTSAPSTKATQQTRS